jgi:hypothetical protein
MKGEPDADEIFSELVSLFCKYVLPCTVSNKLMVL